MIVDSSLFEAAPVRDPFTPQVPQEIRVRYVEPVKPPEPQIEAPSTPPPGPIVELPPAFPEQIPSPAMMGSLPAMTVAGVVWNTDRPQAIINGQIVGIGDIVSGAKILEIQKMGITFLFQGRTETLEIKR